MELQVEVKGFVYRVQGLVACGRGLQASMERYRDYHKPSGPIAPAMKHPMEYKKDVIDMLQTCIYIYTHMSLPLRIYTYIHIYFFDTHAGIQTYRSLGARALVLSTGGRHLRTIRICLGGIRQL